jgi:hypothetical protein
MKRGWCLVVLPAGAHSTAGERAVLGTIITYAPPFHVMTSSRDIFSSCVSDKTGQPFVPAIKPMWRNWQTRWTQNPVSFTGSVGSIPSIGIQWLPAVSNSRHA